MYIGRPLPRVEDDRLLIGKGRYTDDQALPGHPTRHSVSGGPYQHAAQRRVIVASK